MPDRLTTLVHHITTLCPADRLGLTRLAKILWLADVENYRRCGATISGADDYIKDDFGPRHRRLYDAIGELKRSGAVVEKASPTPVGARHELFPIVTPNLEVFSAEEIAIVDRIASAVIALSAKDASDLTHDELWASCYYNESMPVAAAAPVAGRLTPDIAKWAADEFDADRSTGNGI